MQQGKVGADQVVAGSDVHLRLHQRFIAGQVHRRGTGCAGRIDQRRVAIRTDRLDAPFSQRPQQPAFTAAQIQHTLRLAALNRQQHGLVRDRQPTFDGTGADGFDPGLGVVVPALEEGGFRGRH
ncbi:hypothetical protein D3C76_1383760 [compost metagenome]